MQNLELQMQQDLLKESAPSSTIAASLDARIKEYDTLVHQLKAQLSTSHHQLSALKSSGMRTPAETLSSPESRDSTFNTAGFRRLVPQSSSENLASTSLPHTPQPRRDNQISGLSSFQQHSITRQPSTESMASTTLSSLNHQSSTNSLHDDAWEIESNPHLQLQPVHNSALHHHHHLQQQPVQSLHHHTQTANPPSPIQTTNVNVIVHLMTGATLQKYNRRRTKSEPRFVSVNPYTRTISWSKTAPTMGGEVTTVFMRTVFVEDLVDGRSRIVVVGVGREYVFQCGSALEHAIWERGLTLVLQGAQGQGQPQVTVNTTAVGSSNGKGGLLKW
ncbi:hypothetical protein BCR33DRAFT_528586 [Rhizoclosmatium globosum]|uniref:Pleckstrin homology domain-containing protein n=1 Tax=Rhizoclosmatium globosum TaxID=329046 RepID=A0A1Y2CTP9_9FUNG|nr:hypothetical protein BCR33DRAFT_528586 [Rhizoclosmatium globosum]|eukprot:ORY50401.1 hypothetical protein BCR33DRAFT_528586 [Rhizoclosmatium globosum]